MKRTSYALVIATVSLQPFLALADDPPAPVYSRTTGNGSTDWTEYVVDDAAGSVTAAGLLGISGDTVKNVENIRDLVVAFKGLQSDSGRGTLAVAIAPARSSFTPVNLDSYKRNHLIRLLSSTTLSYARATADIGTSKFDRQAVAAEISYIFDPGEDPVIAFDRAVTSREECGVAKATEEVANATTDETTKILAAAVACATKVKTQLRWNRSNAAFAYGHGWIKPTDGGKQHNLGDTFVISATYGFETVPFLRDSTALGVIYRLGRNETVLESLVAGPINRKNTSLILGRLTFGSEKIKALLEVSNAKSNDLTASQRAFKEALGLDLRLYDGLWLSARFGFQRNIAGTSNEIGSTVSLSFSPSALLK